MIGRLWPHGQDRWHAYAKELATRMQRLQIHVEHNWLYCVCTVCGWELEYDRSEQARFRHEVSSHHCRTGPAPFVPEPASPENQLF